MSLASLKSRCSKNVPNVIEIRPLLTLEQVSELLQLPVKSLYRQRSLGQDPGALGIRVGRWVRYEPAVLEAWLAQQHTVLR